MTLQPRPYQTEAVALAIERGSMLMAMVMGSGKTAAAILTVSDLAERGEVRSGAWFTLKTLKAQTFAEIRKWQGGSVHMIQGTAEERRFQFAHARHFRYTILSYDSLIHDWELVRKYLPLDFVVCDEITALKGFQSKRTRRMKSMRDRIGFRFGLTGQPVENRPEELFSMMEWIDPEVLGNFDKFDRTFIVRDGWGRPKRYRNLPLLKSTLDTAMYRKNREDIAEFLPDRIETVVPVVMDDRHMVVMEHIAKEALAVVNALAEGGAGGFDVAALYGRGDSDGGNQAKGDVMKRISAWSLLTDDPRLIQMSADDYDDEDIAAGSGYAKELIESGRIRPSMFAHRPKLEALLDMLEEILEEDPANKVVVFTGYTRMVTLMEEAFRERPYQWVTLTGKTSAMKRGENIRRFNQDPSVRIFVSSDAGAYGVDLPAGNHLVCYDLPFSAGRLAQRLSRIDRTSSLHKHINIVYLIGKDTIEEWQLEVQRHKVKVSAAFVDGQFDAAKGTMDVDLESLREYLQRYLS